MQKFLLTKIRLTWYFFFFLGSSLAVVWLAPKADYDRAALAMFSVNSFLYGFYLAPILTSQKTRIEELHRATRAEANAVFDMVLGLKKLPDDLRNTLQQSFTDYLRTCARQRRPGQGEAQYEELITFCVTYKGPHHKDIDKLLDKLVKNQQNRTQFSMLLSSKVFSHEWLIMLLLFGITIGFIITIDTSTTTGLRFVAALLVAGLSMLLLILLKLSTLTHKKAAQAWAPYHRLIETHYYRID